MTNPLFDSTKRMFEIAGASSTASKTLAGVMVAVVALIPVTFAIDARYAKADSEREAVTRILRLENELHETRIELSRVQGHLDASLNQLRRQVVSQQAAVDDLSRTAVQLTASQRPRLAAAPPK